MWCGRSFQITQIVGFRVPLSIPYILIIENSATDSTYALDLSCIEFSFILSVGLNKGNYWVLVFNVLACYMLSWCFFFLVYVYKYWSVEVYTKCEMLPSTNEVLNYSEGTSLNETQIVIITLFCHMLSCLKNRVRKKFPCSLSKLSLALPFPPISDGILDRQKPVIMPTHLESSWTGNMANKKQKFIRKDFHHFSSWQETTVTTRDFMSFTPKHRSIVKYSAHESSKKNVKHQAQIYTMNVLYDLNLKAHQIHF